MSSTNKTEHYNLPQFIGSDIPTWLGDFNSAMTAIDNGINAAATSASGAATDAATAQKSANDAAADAAAAQKSANDALRAANRCPFPIGYGGFFQTNPNSIYAGTTWEQKKDVFILASGDTYGAGSTGGEAKHTLTKDELPNYTLGSIPAAVPDEHTNWNNGSIDGTTIGNVGPNKPGITTLQNMVIRQGQQYGWAVWTGGGGKSHNNMPPYFAMPFWVRTA